MSEVRVRRALETLVALRRGMTPGAKLDPDALGAAWAEAEHALAESSGTPAGSSDG